MPLIESSSFQPPKLLKNSHLQTIFPAVFRKIPSINYTRQTIPTPDDDFIDLDWLNREKKEVVVLCHGLEGSAESQYIQGMSRIFARSGFGVCAYNYRGCSGRPNRSVRSYHSGATDDLETVLQTIIKEEKTAIYLIGFSLGGNLILKYVGERGTIIDVRIKKAVVFAVPCDLATSCDEIHKRHNRLYLWRFMHRLRKKVKAKRNLLEAVNIDTHALLNAPNFHQFDNLYTGPAHGFKDGAEYYQKCSSRQFISNIKIPTLLVSALDDPFLSPQCYPKQEALENPFFYLELPKHGGHVGFVDKGLHDDLWSERRALEFILNH